MPHGAWRLRALALRLRPAVSCLALVAIIAGPAPAVADNRQTFATATLELIDALVGAAGDEGPAVVSALDGMGRALAAWDGTLRRQEDAIAEMVGRADAPTLAGMRLALAWAHLERGRIRDALIGIDRAIQLDPRLTTAYRLRGIASAEEPERAAAAFRRGWEIDRNDPVKAFRLVQVLVDAGRTDDLEGPLDTLWNAYRRLAPAAGSEQASPFLTRALFRDDAAERPLFPLVAYQEGFARLARVDYDAALEHLREAAARDPLVEDDALRSAPAVQAIAELRQRRTHEAIRLLEEAAAHAPQSSEVRRVLGVAYRTAGRIDEAVARFEAAIDLAPDNERAHLALVLALRDSGRIAPAEAALEAAIRVLPSSGALRWTYAALYHEIGREEETLEHLEAVPTAGIVAGRGHVLAAIGRLHASGARAAQAVRPFQLGVRLNPNNPSAHMDLGSVYRAQGRTGPALAAFVAAALLDPDLVEAHTAIGQIHLAADRLEEAAMAFRRAVSLRSGHADAQYGLARALRRLGRTEEAAAHFEAFARLQQAAIAAQRRMYEVNTLRREAALHETAGRHDEAVAVWEAIVERVPDHAGHRAALGDALVRADRHDAAMRVLEQAAALPAAPPAVYRRLGELYALAGRAEESARAHAEHQRRQERALLRTATPP